MATPRNHSVFKAFAMLKSFSSRDEWVTSSELSRRANLPEASGYRLIQTLEELGAVTRGPRGRYRPGMLLVSLSEKVIIGDLLHEAGHRVIEDLAARYNVTVHIGILEGGMVTYASKAATPASYTINTRRGAQLEAYCSALGKVLLAALPDDELENFIMEGELVALTPATITEPCTLRAQLRAVREAGHGVDDREIRPDMSCIAVPIKHPQGRTVAAISITEHAEKICAARSQEFLAALQSAAADIAARIFPADPRSAPTMLGNAKRYKRAPVSA
ncbi:MAG: IclR family transcriptional regulator [Sandarakinorhabdus sp.]|jgi:DNA-binding IclR family transcriptional regulator